MPAGRRVILTLHGLGVSSRPLASGEERYWISPDLLRRAIELAQRHRKSVDTHFCFDDGNRSDLEIGIPILAAGGYTAIHFVLAGKIGEPHYLSDSDIRDLTSAGHRIGSHGADHVDWRGLDQKSTTREFDWARVRIAKASGASVADAALPFGRYDGPVLKQLQRAGYSRVYSSDGGEVRGDTWPIPRTSLTANLTVEDITDILLGREGIARRSRRRLTRAIKRRL